MKKIIAVIVATVLILAAGILFFKSGLFKKTPAQKSSESSETSPKVSSENISSSGGQPFSQNESTGSDDTINKIKSSIDVDWKKYRLSKEDKKTVNGKEYLTYTMWNDDYQEGPLILVDQSTGKVYTWVSSDKSPAPAENDKAFDKTVHTVTVTITDSAMMSYIGKTSDGKQLTVPRYDVDMVNFNSVKIGDKIKIYYTGVINGDDMSRAFVTKLEKIG